MWDTRLYMREAHVIVTPPESKPFTVVLDKAEVTAGRDLGADITIEDSLLSREHLRFVWKNERWNLEDQGSRNGTFLSGKRIAKGERATLDEGAEITAGLSKLKFSMHERATDAPPLRRVAKPTEDFFSVQALLQDKVIDVPGHITRLLIRISEEIIPERDPDRVVRRLCSVTAELLGAREVSVQRLKQDGSLEALAMTTEALKLTKIAVSEVEPLIEHRGAMMAGDRLLIALDAPKHAVLVADVPRNLEKPRIQMVVALANLCGGLYESAQSHRDLRRDNQRLLDQVRVGFAYDVDTPACLHGRSSAAQSLRSAVEKLATARGAFTVVGEPGTGKELVARAIHARSSHSSEPFVVIDATEKNRLDLDRLRQLHGMLFIEHAEALVAETRAALLTFANSRVVLSASETTGDALELVPLRARREDISLVAEKLLEELNAQHKTRVTLSTEARQWLEEQAWPGNIRGMSLALERAVLTADGSTITPEDLISKATDDGPELSLPDAIADFEKEYVLRVLEAQHGHRIRTAGILGISRQALGRKLRAWGLISQDAED